MYWLKQILFTVLQSVCTLVVLFIIYMTVATATSDFSGIDGTVGLVIFQPLYAIVISVITIVICVLIGLPLRVNRKLNAWWSARPLLQVAAILLGIALIILSFQSGKTIAWLTATGWFLTAFSILHYYRKWYWYDQ